MKHYFDMAKIEILTDFERLDIYDVNQIISKHEDDYTDILNFRDKFISWKNERTQPRSSSSIEFSQTIGSSRNTLKQYLRANLNGRMLLGKAPLCEMLSSLEKQVVVRQTADFILLSVPAFPKEFPRDSDYVFAWDQVNEIFPGKFRKSEMVGSKEFDENGKLLASSRGKLRQRIYDVARSIKDPREKKTREKTAKRKNTDESDVSDNIEDDGSIRDSEDESEVDQEAQESLNFLKKNKGPESKVMDAWEKTVDLRKKCQIEDFPFIKMPFAHKMLLFDFDLKYPGKTDEFKRNFSEMKLAMKTQYDMEITQKYGKELLLYLDKKPAEKTENLLYLMLLPFLFKPKTTTKNNMKRTTALGIAHNFIYHAEVSSLTKFIFEYEMYLVFRPRQPWTWT